MTSGAMYSGVPASVLVLLSTSAGLAGNAREIFPISAKNQWENGAK